MITYSRLREGMKLSADQDESLPIYRAMVIAAWEQVTSRKWNARTDYVETLSPAHDRTSMLLLELWPITEIGTVRERDHDETTWSALTTGEDFQLTGRRRLYRTRNFWKNVVEVTYSGGVSEADEDVQQALIVQARFFQERLGNEKLITKSQNFEGGGGVFEEAFLHPTFKMLAKLKKRKA